MPRAALWLMPMLAASLLAACSGENLLSQGSIPIASDGTAFVGATSDQPQFNPFKDASAAAVPARQVMVDPPLAEVMKTGSLPEMALGRPHAPVTIIEYASLTCPYCRKFQLEAFPELKRLYIDTGKVRFILREFPIGFQSGAATIALRCAPPEKYFDLYGKFMAQQGAWVSQEVRRDPIFKVAAQVGMTRAQFDACYQNQGMIQGLNWVKERGRTLGIIGTPNFFINGKLVKSVIGMKEIREMVDPIVSGRIAAGDPAIAR